MMIIIIIIIITTTLIIVMMITIIIIIIMITLKLFSNKIFLYCIVFEHLYSASHSINDDNTEVIL